MRDNIKMNKEIALRSSIKNNFPLFMEEMSTSDSVGIAEWLIFYAKVRGALAVDQAIYHYINKDNI